MEEWERVIQHKVSHLAYVHYFKFYLIFFFIFLISNFNRCTCVCACVLIILFLFHSLSLPRLLSIVFSVFLPAWRARATTTLLDLNQDWRCENEVSQRRHDGMVRIDLPLLNALSTTMSGLYKPILFMKVRSCNDPRPLCIRT